MPGRYQRNVDALQQVVPSDYGPEDIVASLGVNWITAKDIEDFAAELLPHRPQVTYEPNVPTWTVNIERYQRFTPEARSEYGTESRDAYTLIETALRNNPVVITKTVVDENGTKRSVKDPEAIVAAEEKLVLIKERFQDWVWSDPERTDRLCKEFNWRFRSEVPQEFEGRYTTVDGSLESTPLRDYQRAFIERGTRTPAGLADHSVGSGKTYTMVALSMKLKQMGLVEKSMIITPNHLLEQVAGDAKRFFPGARVLMATSADMKSRESRQLFAARVATGKWDIVVMTHSSFKLIPMHPENERKYLQGLVDEYRIAMEDLDGDSQRHSVKALAKQIEQWETKILRLIDKPRDNGAYWEQLGIGALMVDESQAFKNLAVASSMEGFSMPAAQRASDLHMKLEYMREKSEGKRWGYFFTGTPITNTLAEVYNLERYLNPDGLERRGLAKFGSWVANHANIETRIEVSVDGRTFKQKRRPYDFLNVPELSRAYRTFTHSSAPQLSRQVVPDRTRVHRCP